MGVEEGAGSGVRGNPDRAGAGRRDRYVLDLREIDRADIALVGGKGANLGELSRIQGIRVPPGFCVTTDAFRRVLAESPPLVELLERLARIGPDERVAIGELSEEIRRAIEAVAISEEVAAAVAAALAPGGEQLGHAVRSSATAEDLPSASFAGQHDSYLGVVGPAAVLAHVSRCWASLFTERAVRYRARAGLDHREARMAVVVQQMVSAEAAGVLFTADPVTSNRTVSAVQAGLGLGEALVSGRTDADTYRVRDGELLARSVARKRLAIRASPAGGTEEQAIAAERAEQPALSDAQILGLVQLGRRVEAHFACPQDIEWCLAGEDFSIVQSRPITTLFPIPAATDGEPHVYVSVGHQQMMTDAMKPLGFSLFQLTAFRPMYEAGGRLFVDVAEDLASPARRAALVQALGTSDPLIGDALEAVLERDELIPPPQEEDPARPPAGDPRVPGDADPALVAELIERSERSIADLERRIRSRSGPDLLDFIVADVEELKRLIFDLPSRQAIWAAMTAASWLNEHLEAWLGERNAADTLSRSVDHNITAEMGLALLDVADAIRPHPDVVAALEEAADDGFLDELSALPGGSEARAAIRGFLDRYGMRCPGEIDVTRPRWSERPSTVLPAILSNVKNFEAGAAERRFERGRLGAAEAEQRLLERLSALPGGGQKADETKQAIDRLRAFTGYREYPKYVIVSRYFVYKRALLQEAERLVRAGLLGEPADIFYLTIHELHDLARSNEVDGGLLARRRREFRTFEVLTPPRVMTSDGEVFAGAYRREDLPGGALAGLAVSAGTVDGRARVVLDMADAELEPGDVLVTTYTDPSWSPLFLGIAGLVTEVGGLMTHGAVIAREYGLPAVVGVEHATRLIADGQRIRVHGAEGYVEILS